MSPADETYGALPDALAELARAGSAVLSRPFTQVNFVVSHVKDRPGHLSEALVAEGGRTGGFNETLTSSAYGVGLVIGTRLGRVDAKMISRHRGSSAPLEVLVEKAGDDGSVFRGSARPNPTFIYPPGRSLEGLITLESAQVPVTLRHALAVKEVLTEIADLAAADGLDSPLLSLQSPVQFPFEGNAGLLPKTVNDWGWACSAAVRFAIALTENTSANRTRIADRLASFCATRGYGFALGDLRLGYRSGNWYPVVEHQKTRARQYVHTFHDDLHQAPLVACVPVTLVGPARVGSTRALLNALALAPDVGILACTISAMDDLAFIHLLLTGPQTAAVSGGSFDPRLRDLGVDSRRDLAETLARIVGQLTTGKPDAISPVTLHEPLAARAADYQALVGPVISIEPKAGMRRRPIWVSWHAEGSEADMRLVIEALMKALRESGLGPNGDDDRAAPNFEYLICRRIGVSFTRGRGKMSISDEAARKALARVVSPGSGDLEWGQTRLCVRIEDAWRGVLYDEGLAGLVDVGVAWREYWRDHAHP